MPELTTMLESHLVSGSLSDSVKELDVEVKETSSVEQFDLVAYYENNAGRLVIDPGCVFFYFEDTLHKLSVCREARIEFGEEVAKRLKLTADGTTVLWPQPTDDPEDPQNVRCSPWISLACL